MNACKENQKQTDIADIEAREDALELERAYTAQKDIERYLVAVLETQAIDAGKSDDAADDPAIWVNPEDPSLSLVFGTNKKGGLAAYTLAGKEDAYYALGKVNNVDILYNFPVRDTFLTLLGCTNRTSQSVDLFEVNSDGSLRAFKSETFLSDTTRVDDIYGFCFASDTESNAYYLLYNGKNGLMRQYGIKAVSTDSLYLELEREVAFDGQTEGMVADERHGRLYVGQENLGVYELSLSPDSTRKVLIPMSTADNNPSIRYDVEGLTLYQEGDKSWLLVSSQGNFSYAVFDLSNEAKYIGSFKIVDGEATDGVEETDGLDIVSDSLNPRFPQGILVLQDGFNYEGDSLVSQNFKYVSVTDLTPLFP